MERDNFFPGKVYTVTSPNGCTVYDNDGLTLATVEANKQASFVATTSTITWTDEEAKITATFSAAPALGNGSGGGVTIQFDTTPTSGSTAAVTSGGLYNILYSSTPAIGAGAYTGPYSVAYGNRARALSGGVVFGNNVESTTNNANVFGQNSKVTAKAGMAFGNSVTLNDAATVVWGVKTVDGSLQTLLYLMIANSPLATTYENGEACLGYVVKDASGNVTACGTRKLSELLTNNTAFAPAALDLDAPAPTPFLPTGITDPIEIEELTD